jgi:hypothetical protein
MGNINSPTKENEYGDEDVTFNYDAHVKYFFAVFNKLKKYKIFKF